MCAKVVRNCCCVCVLVYERDVRIDEIQTSENAWRRVCMCGGGDVCV